jgi:hypothetical protein
LPFLGEFLEKKVRGAIRENLVRPMGCCFHVPVPKARKLGLHLLSTIHNRLPPLPPRPVPSRTAPPEANAEETPLLSPAPLAPVDYHEPPAAASAPIGPPPALPPRPSRNSITIAASDPALVLASSSTPSENAIPNPPTSNASSPLEFVPPPLPPRPPKGDL